jgi:hypothetical protein
MHETRGGGRQQCQSQGYFCVIYFLASQPAATNPGPVSLQLKRIRPLLDTPAVRKYIDYIGRYTPGIVGEQGFPFPRWGGGVANLALNGSGNPKNNRRLMTTLVSILIGPFFITSNSNLQLWFSGGGGGTAGLGGLCGPVPLPGWICLGSP